MSCRKCWRCGASWRCEKCGSFEQRPNGKGCAECHRQNAKRQTARLRAERDIEITPAIRAYLAAFDRYLMASKTGDPVALRDAARDRAAALNAIEDDGDRLRRTRLPKPQTVPHAPRTRQTQPQQQDHRH